MSVLMRPWGHLHFRVRGPDGGLPVLLLSSLGTDLRMWEEVVDRLPELRTIGMDKRGHGLSATPADDWTLDDLVQDCLALLDHLGIRQALVAGCSIGGMIAQALAVAAPERVAALFLSNTAMKVGSPESWAARIEGVRTMGLRGLAPQVLERWFAPGFLDSDAARPWGTMLMRGDPAGYTATCRLLARTDLRAVSPRIACPVLMLAGSADQSTPPGVVAETAAAIPGARLVVIEGSGHIPAIDNPDEVASLLAKFHQRPA
jgi:3-oxoadipate enol-lactonase